MKSDLTDQEASFLYYLIRSFKIQHNEVLEWAYSQYDKDGALAWIEELIITYDMSDVKEILETEFEINEIESDIILGEIAYKYQQGIYDYIQAASGVYLVITDSDDCTQQQLEQVHILDSYFDWHKNNKKYVVPILEGLILKHENKFLTLKDKFCNF